MSYRFVDSFRAGSGGKFEKLVHLVGFIVRIRENVLWTFNGSVFELDLCSVCYSVGFENWLKYKEIYIKTP
jgi:hypothetical protein